MQINVAAHDSDASGVVEADEKADAIEAAIDALAPACFSASRGIVPDSVILDATPPNQITELEITDDMTQQTIGKKVTPVPPSNVKGTARFSGAPAGGTAGVSVGDVFATTDTTGMTSSEIMDELAQQLAAGGVKAVFQDGAILIYPLDETLFAENTDSGLALSIGGFVVDHVPTVSGWGLAVMALLVLTAGTVVVMRRRSMASGA